MLQVVYHYTAAALCPEKQSWPNSGLITCSNRNKGQDKCSINSFLVKLTFTRCEWLQTIDLRKRTLAYQVRKYNSYLLFVVEYQRTRNKKGNVAIRHQMQKAFVADKTILYTTWSTPLLSRQRFANFFPNDSN